MDPSQVVFLLTATLSPSDSDRKLAEEHLKKLELAPGFPSTLLQICSSNEVNPAIRQSAAISLKQLVRSKWYKPEDDPEFKTIADADKSVLKQNIVEVLIYAPPRVRVQMGIMMNEIVENEYPDRWPELLPKIMSYLSSTDVNVVGGALEALRVTVKRYEYIQPGKGRRKPLQLLVETSFPVVYTIFQNLLGRNEIEAATMVKTVCKIFWSAVNYGIPPYLLDDGNFTNWMSIFFQLLQKPIPDSMLPADPDDRKKYPWWKCKKWVANIFHRLFQRYGDPKLGDAKAADTIAFAKRFSTKYAPKILEAFLGLLNLKRTGGYLLDSVACTCINFLASSIRHPQVYKLMKPHLDVLFKEIIFSYLSFGDADQALWKEDPQEYLRREFDIVEEYYNPRSASVNFVTDLARLRGKTHLNPMMNFVGEILLKYAANPTVVKAIRDKDGALLIIGSLADKLCKVKEYAIQLEPLLAAHVLPELQNPHGFLRARAIWIFTQYWDIEWKNPQNFVMGLRIVTELMKDKELPVKIQAATCLKYLVKSDLAVPEIKPRLATILEDYFHLMNEIDNDELVASLEMFIDRFEEDMAPYAVTLCAKLSEAFMRMVNADEEDSAIAAMECLTTIQTILRSIHDKPNLYPHCEQVLMPLLNKLLDPEFTEFFEEGLKIITFITFFAPTISEGMWTLFPKMYNIFENHGMDFVADLLVTMDNYITRAPDVFLSGGYVNLVMNMYQKVVAEARTNETNAGDTVKLIEVVLQNCRGKIDHLIEPIVTIAVDRLQKARKTFLKVLLIEVVANALFYNPALTLQILEKKNWTKNIFEAWFQLIPKHHRMHDKKLAILALTSLFSVSASLPPVVKAGSGHIFSTIIQLCGELEKQKEEFYAKEKKEDEDDEEDIDEDNLSDDDYELNEDEEDKFKDEPDLIERAKAAAAFYEDEQDDSDEDSEDDSEIESDGETSYAIDETDELVFFIEYLKELSVKDAAMYQALTSQLNPGLQGALNNLAQVAEKRKVENEQKKLQAEQEKAQQKN